MKDNQAHTTNDVQQKTINFGIDFDDTISDDPELFRLLIAMMQKSGHNVYIITIRSSVWNNDDITDFVESLHTPIPVHFTEGAQKAQYVEDMDLRIDIWIDDQPLMIPIVQELESCARVCRKLEQRQK